MKKSLFALAATTAIAGAAQAQSSVTVYGILDMGYVGSNAREVSATGAVTKIQKNAFGQSQESTNRLGFKGTEDLGGGTSAFFTVEFGLTPQFANASGGTATDSIQGTSQADGSALNNRQSFVGLKKNGIGQGAFGRQYTPVFNSAIATDPGNFNNTAGNVIYNSGSVYASSTSIQSGTNNSIGFTNRASNAFTLKSDNFAGFTVSGMYAMNNQNQTVVSSSSGGNTNWNGWGLGADFTWQKLYVAAAYQSFKTQVTGADIFSAPTFNLGVGPLGAQSASAANTTSLTGYTMLSDKQTYAGATYDFGVLKAYLQWVGRKVQQDSSLTSAGAAGTAGNQLNRNAQQLGVRSYITPTIEAWASVGTGKYKGPIAAAGEPASVNFVGYQLGSNYYLSKRTNVYAIYGQQQTSSATGGTNGSGNSANQYALGLRHTF